MDSKEVSIFSTAAGVQPIKKTKRFSFSMLLPSNIVRKIIFKDF